MVFDVLDSPALCGPSSLMFGEFCQPQFGLFDLDDKRRWEDGTESIFDPGVQRAG